MKCATIRPGDALERARPQARRPQQRAGALSPLRLIASLSFIERPVKLEPSGIITAPPKDDALVIVVVAPHGVAPPELPVVVMVNGKSHAVSPDNVDRFASGELQSG